MHFIPSTSTSVVYEVINEAVWDKPRLWEIRANFYGEPRIPFSLYVQCQMGTIPTILHFFQYQNLPAELQLNVLQHCDIPTLFQLMKTSRAMRIEARKLFWSDTDAWYSVRGLWLLTGGHEGRIPDATDLFVDVEQVEVDFEFMNDLWRNQSSDSETPEAMLPSSVEGRVRQFWQTLLRHFPRTARVVVSETIRRRSDESPLKDFETIARCCPTGISLFASFLQDGNDSDRRLKRSFWQRIEGDASAAARWRIKHFPSPRNVILPPPKEFRGPVGAYEAMFYWRNRRVSHMQAANVLLREAWERHYFHGRHEPWNCPVQGCAARFELRGQWTHHACLTGHDSDMGPPVEAREAFKRHKAMCDRILRDEIELRLNMIEEAWGEDGSEERHMAEQAFLYQLEHDPLYEQGQLPKESSVWLNYKRFLDPTAVQ